MTDLRKQLETILGQLIPLRRQVQDLHDADLMAPTSPEPGGFGELKRQTVGALTRELTTALTAVKLAALSAAQYGRIDAEEVASAKRAAEKVAGGALIPFEVLQANQRKDFP